MGWWRAIFTHFDTFGGPIVTLLYPLYASIKAIESPSKLDDQQWLTYWILYSFVTLVEMTLWQLFSWIPFWGKLKFFAACWLVLPQFNGAAFMYECLVKKKLFKQNPSKNNSASLHKLEQMISPSVQSSLRSFIDSNGETALENLIASAKKEARKHRHSPTKEGFF